MSVFEIRYEDVDPDSPQAGQAGVVPWDSETFGFNVANYRLTDGEGLQISGRQLESKIASWASANRVEMIATSSPADQPVLIHLLQCSGFVYNDTTISIRYGRLNCLKLPSSRIEMQPADPEDEKAVRAIAEQMFKHGRYHADARFPRHLADRRYGDWISRAMGPDSRQQVILVKRPDGEVRGFSVIEIREKQGYFHLLASAASEQGSTFGVGLAASTLRYFRDHGVEAVNSKISAHHLRIVNLHAYLGCRFMETDIEMHWHAPDAPHLVAPSPLSCSNQSNPGP